MGTIEFVFYAIIFLVIVLMFTGVAVGIVWFSLVITTVKEGSYKVSVINGAEFHKVMANIPGYKVVERFEEDATDESRPVQFIVPENDPGKNILSPIENFIGKRTGWYIMGPVPFLYKPFSYRLSFNELVDEVSKNDRESVKKVVKHRDLTVENIFHQSPYAFIFRGLEDRAMQELEMILLVSKRSIVPQWELFANQPTGKWLTILEAKIEEITRGYVSRSMFSGMTQQMSSADGSDDVDIAKVIRGMSKPVQGDRSKVAPPEVSLIDIIVDDYFSSTFDYLGVAIKDAQLIEVNLGEKDQKLQDAQTAEQLAKLEGQATVTTAKAKAKARKLEAAAEKVFRMNVDVEPEKALRDALGDEAYGRLKQAGWQFGNVGGIIPSIPLRQSNPSNQTSGSGDPGGPNV